MLESTRCGNSDAPKVCLNAARLRIVKWKARPYACNKVDGSLVQWSVCLPQLQVSGSDLVEWALVEVKGPNLPMWLWQAQTESVAGLES